jgi:TolB-like protein/DNA-binding winged helix-turn-helix (wHTH) protein/Tfp pilus assembly protein PilF
VNQSHKSYLLDDYWLAPGEQLLSRSGQPIHLPKRPFQVLTYLIEHRDRFVSRAELLDLFWDGKDVYDDALRKCVGSIRKALDDQSDHARFIETRWGVGYRYIGPIEEQVAREETAITEIERTRGVRIVFEEEIQNGSLTDSPIVAVAPAKASILTALKLYPKTTTLILMVLSIVVCGSILISYLRRSAAPASRTAPIRSVAVLPLKNLSNDGETEYFSNGLTEDLINTLSRIEGLRVISRGSAFAFKDKELDPRDVAKQLRVGAVIEGSVLKTGERVRVNVRLVDAEDGSVLWASNTYDRPVGDIFTIQDEIARNAAAGLRLQLNGEDQKRLAKRYTNNIEAYNELLRGWYFWSQRTPSGLKKAIESYRRATEIDSHCAFAYAGLAASYAMGVWYIPLEPREAMRNAKAAATKAVEIDPNLPEAHLAMAHVLSYEWDWSGAQQEMERARGLDPNLSDYGYAYTLLLSAGKPDEAVRWIRRSEELDPLSPLVGANVGQILYYARRYDEAIEQGRKTIDLDPNYAMAHAYLGQAYIQKRMYREAVEELQKAITLSERNPEVIAILGNAYAAAGDRKEAEKVINELIESSQRRYVPSYAVAAIYAELGRKDEAFAWLEKAYAERSPTLVDLKVDPTLDTLRSDPRYVELLRRVGLQA